VIIPPYRTVQYEYKWRIYAVFDRRVTYKGEPYLHENAWYDSVEDAQEFDHALYGRPTMKTVQAELAEREKKRRQPKPELEYHI
jgi:hypothetical protein